MRLIEAGELWTGVQMLPHNGDMISSEEVEQAIADAPTIDAVPVVRCKDCKYYHADTLSCDFTPHAKYYERPNWYEDDFCSYGKRRDEDV